MLVFTAPDRSEVRLEAPLVIRVRATFPNEAEGDSRTRIDWAVLNFVIEQAPAVAGAIADAHPTFARLTLPNGQPVWFDGRKATGPLKLAPFERGGGVRSAFTLAGKRQYVADTPQQLHDAIAASGGTVLPIPDEGAGGFMESVAGRIRNWISPEPAWD